MCPAVLPHCTGSHENLESMTTELPAKLVANDSTATTASHSALALQGYQAILFGRVANILGWGVRWAGQGSKV
eukprot:1160165-Pelagomonas_calceolata.AAC.4